jgi:hypothetical protein
MRKPYYTHCTRWDGLPAEMQIKILESQDQPLADMAQQATISKIFQAIYKERSAAEEAWLISTTYSLLGRDLVNLLLLHLTTPRRGGEV